MLHAPDRLVKRRVIVTGEIEKAEQVPVADIKKEVAGPGVVAVFDQLDQREAQKLLVVPNGLLDVAADQGQMMDAGGRRRAPIGVVA